MLLIRILVSLEIAFLDDRRANSVLSRSSSSRTEVWLIVAISVGVVSLNSYRIPWLLWASQVTTDREKTVLKRHCRALTAQLAGIACE